MGGKIGLICILLAFSHLILRIWLVETERKELPDEGKEVSIWGKIIIALIGIITCIVIIIVDGSEGKAMKWFWMLFIITAMGFQSFIDWKYLKGSKEYIASLIVLIIGVTLVYFLF
ncbi:DUF4181 domain-containing protein [Paenibacillus macquariensis]|uniref:DUF4181 domain-containing protein n=1 Tax=Paenibacillus macquariensis TaxID=948756 RepID=A0ABY1KDZ2_9BACL|nr:DUF4181 domain-containing protein [Paenibacillus macquariensis]MEC0093150.1 DUF4181 domain-containing protein [Paenibacillus macquariensis]OAB29916.1 hypothetical protein PMSM_23560 [Paenibacillus macquariensis subsp. macquariensis]SIR68504.1 protein of unknown function [Paenibacillus macquariensis]